jgi:hypothetical protein
LNEGRGPKTLFGGLTGTCGEELIQVLCREKKPILDIQKVVFGFEHLIKKQFDTTPAKYVE